MSLKSIVPKKVGLAVASGGLVAVMALSSGCGLSKQDVKDIVHTEIQSALPNPQYATKQDILDAVKAAQPQPQYATKDDVTTIVNNAITTALPKDYITQNQFTATLDQRDKNLISELETMLNQRTQIPPNPNPYPTPNPNPNGPGVWTPSNPAGYLSDTRSYFIDGPMLNQQWAGMNSVQKSEMMAIFGNQLCLDELLDNVGYNGYMGWNGGIKVDNLTRIATVTYNSGVSGSANIQRNFFIDPLRFDMLERDTLLRQTPQYYTMVLGGAQK